jgi:hypothetical protein
MNTDNSISQNDIPFKNRTGWLIFFSVGALQGLACLIWLARIPGDPKNGLLFGYSGSRLVMMATALALAVIFLLLIHLALRSRKFQTWLQIPVDRTRKVFYAICAVLMLILTSSWVGMVMLRADPGEATYAVFERLLPVLTLVSLLSLEGLAWLAFVRSGLDWRIFKEYQPPVRIGLWIVAACTAIGLTLALTGFGITPDEFFCGSPGVPLLAWQIAGSGLIAILGFIFFRLMKSPPGWKTDLVLFFMLWVGAYALWMSQPVPRSYFTPSPRAPNFEVYPYSDAGFYDYVSQSILTGNGFLNHQIITRPLYAVLLAAFHTLVGQSYNGMIALQTIILALFPALLYLLGKTLHSREVGILTGFLAIWREMNLMAATPLTEVSTSKMLMTDSITGVAIAGLILWLVWWQNKRPTSLVIALAAGGMLGLMLLLRSQSLIFLPLIIIWILVNQRRQFRRGLAAAAIFTLGTILSFSPWLVRNYQLTGQLVLDQPSQAAITATRFALSLDTVDESLKLKSSQEVSATVTHFVADHPAYVLKFMAAHFLNNEFSSLTIIPLKLDFIDARDNFNVTTPFWLQGVKGLTTGQLLLLICNLTVIITGLAYAFWKMRWVGLIPLFAHLSYAFTSGMGRISGWRFVQPVDWVIYLYFAIGLGCLFFLLLRVLGWKPADPLEKNSEAGFERRKKTNWGQMAILAVVLVLLGGITPAVENLVPQRYPVEDKNLLIEKIISDPQISGDLGMREQIQSFKGQEKAVALWGRALYPRFYIEGKGEPGTGWMAYKARDYAKLGFVVITPTGERQVILPAENAPQYFPNGSDVILVGCQKNDWIEAAVVLVGSVENKLYLSSQSTPFECQ